MSREAYASICRFGFSGLLERWVLYGLLFTPYVAVLDIALILHIFKGDLRVT